MLSKNRRKRVAVTHATSSTHNLSCHPSSRVVRFACRYHLAVPLPCHSGSVIEQLHRSEAAHRAEEVVRMRQLDLCYRRSSHRAAASAPPSRSDGSASLQPAQVVVRNPSAGVADPLAGGCRVLSRGDLPAWGQSADRPAERLMSSASTVRSSRRRIDPPIRDACIFARFAFSPANRSSTVVSHRSSQR